MKMHHQVLHAGRIAVCLRATAAHVVLNQLAKRRLGIRTEDGLAMSKSEETSLRERSVPRPSTACRLAVCLDLVGGAQQLDASGVFLDPVHGAVEVRRLAVRRKDIEEENRQDGALYELASVPCVRVVDASWSSPGTVTYRKKSSGDNDKEVERLLRRPRSLLLPGQIAPADATIVAQDGDFLSQRPAAAAGTAVRRRVLPRLAPMTALEQW